MDASTLHCASCGAAVQPDETSCRHCGCQVATVACPACLARVSVHASFCSACGHRVGRPASGGASGPCPACKVTLASLAVGQLRLDQCGRCGGLWVGREVFEDLARDQAKRADLLGLLGGRQAAPPVLEEVHYRPCAVCKNFMNRVNYGRISGVIVDVCKAHGVWFDRDELARVVAFIQGGGLDRARLQQVEEMLAETRKANLALQSRPATAGGPPAWDGSGVGFNTGALLVSLAFGMLDLFDP